MGFSQLYSREWILFTVSVVLILVLLILFVPRASEQADAMEQTRFELRLAELNAALRLKSMQLIADPKSSKIEPGINPFVWLDYYDPTESPEVTRYLGEMKPEQATDAYRMWIYDPELRAIGYLPSADIELDGAMFKRGEWLWFQVIPSSNSIPSNWKLLQIEGID